ncbi:hypothetical protein BD626DRAFT_254893 [Schizophyllum amplum]|uniref:Uncharacterized protein n=1 Tax=Schizophyllum amplum TaxID=97359 RepID=A0A550CIL7_9AGAR|nr:hypothetical protein BD626DRAFT_254893 [Auriculariopsis ampla]
MRAQPRHHRRRCRLIVTLTSYTAGGVLARCKEVLYPPSHPENHQRRAGAFIAPMSSSTITIAQPGPRPLIMPPAALATCLPWATNGGDLHKLRQDACAN